MCRLLCRLFVNWPPLVPVSALGSVDQLAMIVNAGLNVEGFAALEHSDFVPFMSYLSKSLAQGSASGLQSSLSSIAVSSLRTEVIKGVTEAEQQLTSGGGTTVERKIGTFAPFRQLSLQEINVGEPARLRIVFEEIGNKGSFPRKVELYFYTDPACTNCVRRVAYGNTNDLVLDCSRLYFQAYSTQGVALGPQNPLPKTVNVSYLFTCYSSSSGLVADQGSVLSSTMSTTLQLVDALLDSAESSSAVVGSGGVASGEHDVPLLIELLQSLPYVTNAKLAATACRTATRLTQQWAQSVAVTGSCDPGIIAVLQDMYVRMERAHSWLRTVGVSRWSGTSILPTHVQVWGCNHDGG